jgi:hypothetical protein
MKLGMMLGLHGMMFGLPGIAAVYDSALSRQQGRFDHQEPIRPSETRLRSPRERAVRCVPSSAVRLFQCENREMQGVARLRR